MNHGLELSLKLERHLAALEAAGEVNGDEEAAAALTTTTTSWGGEEDASGGGGAGMGMCLEDRALELAVEETWRESGERWRPLAANGRSIRIGEIILIVDSDTVVPEDCFRDAARELAESPEVAIILHESGELARRNHKINK